MAFKVPEEYRVLGQGYPKSDASFGNNGMFIIPVTKKLKLTCIASDGGGWEHVSVSTKNRIPTYYEMKRVRRLFWGPEDVVIEFHMGEKDHINCHSHCLHLWRPSYEGAVLPTPPKIMVGF